MRRVAGARTVGAEAAFNSVLVLAVVLYAQWGRLVVKTEPRDPSLKSQDVPCLGDDRSMQGGC